MQNYVPGQAEMLPVEITPGPKPRTFLRHSLNRNQIGATAAQRRMTGTYTSRPGEGVTARGGGLSTFSTPESEQRDLEHDVAKAQARDVLRAYETGQPTRSERIAIDESERRADARTLAARQILDKVQRGEMTIEDAMGYIQGMYQYTGGGDTAALLRAMQAQAAGGTGEAP